MKLTIDDLIDTFQRLNNKDNVDFSFDLEEQDTGGGSSSGGGSGSYPAPTKWSSQYATTRGPANQIGNTKWKDSYQTKRGVANTLY